MNINAATAATLGDKLAGLNLTAEEGVLLTTLLASEPEVSGFSKLNYEEIKDTYLPKVINPLPRGWKVEEDWPSVRNIEQSGTKVEWT